MQRFSKSLIVFDWDGTLMDSLSLIIASFKQAAEKVGLPIPTDTRVRPLIGLGLPEAIRAAFGDLKLTAAELDVFRSNYSDTYVKASKTQQLFPGVDELLDMLSAQGFELAVATGKSRAGLERALDQSGLRQYFRYSRCADEALSKPHPKMLNEILALSKVEPKNAMMIGDTCFDLDMAKKAEISSVAVSYGAHPAGQLEASDPAYIASSIADLKQWLCENCYYGI